MTVSTGEKKRNFAGDAVQPSWSPHGMRIAFWGVFAEPHVGQRDIWTIPADGGTAVPVTTDPAIDWNPVWSPDGRHLYFSSDRGGPMNLWRVAIDEKTGVPSGPFEPLTAPSSQRDAAVLATRGLAAHAMAARANRCFFDTPGDGSIWVRGANYKAGFTAQGATMIPYLGSNAPANRPLRLTPESVTTWSSSHSIRSSGSIRSPR